MPVQLESIAFNWGGTAQNSALRIRSSYAAAIAVPEWVRGGRNEPSAYAIAQILAGGNAPQLRVSFSGAEAGEVVSIAAAGNGTVLGNIAAQDVHFDEHGNATVQMPLANCTIGAATVGIVNTTFTWTATEGGGQPYQVAQTHHRSYLTLTTPTAPWTQNGTNQDPWATALEAACTYANGTATATNAGGGITTGVNGSGAQYNPAPSLFINNAGALNVRLTTFLNWRAGGAVFPMQLNCSDCGALVMLLSNLLGATFYSGEFVNSAVGDITTLPINGMGGAGWNIWNWVFHEVCWVQFATNSQVFDAAARLTQAAPVLPSNMQFDTAYRPALTNDNVQTRGAAERYPVQ
ncbi:hypothetical protein JY651_50990 [Pyxidicoccus parkwayensis]|uniref:Uncharacterized protein n=1 Tax=Pyxidicoccus parkwayensis TaxID=2813578 RepID=A0ABX7NX70_9BACT|nr:hypothetical protein [Pyxidicoccus parkwaysis]QSQ23313.1 hypothetical protein JY651_50990 [Pyxidicoccus parkwaysis]